MKIPYHFLLFSVLIFFSNIAAGNAQEYSYHVQDKTLQQQKAYLEQILKWLPEDRPGLGRVSFLDSTFRDWLDRTGELPPDFSQMISIPHLPDPLMIDEGGDNIPVKTSEQWLEKKRVDAGTVAALCHRDFSASASEYEVEDIV